MHLPNYKDGSIVNLMSSIGRALGYRHPYKPLRSFQPRELKAKNIVLIVIDGLGYEFVRKYGKNTLFEKYLRAKITSVFPATTATAITTFHTGVAPQQHAVTGWFMHLREVGLVSIPLRFVARGSKVSLTKRGVKPTAIFDKRSFFNDIKVPSYAVYGKDIANSQYNSITAGKVKRLTYSTLRGFTRQIIKAVHKPGRKFVYAYWADFDLDCHEYGTKSPKAREHCQQLDKAVQAIENATRDTDTTIIITGDHGISDSTTSRMIDLAKHPKLAETLTLPLCGDRRLAYCYVRPSKAKQFESYVKHRLKQCCQLFRSEELIKKNYFGLFKPNPKLADRVGDYALMMKENYTIKDNLLGEKRDFEIGNHGGVSREEMFVPLIVIEK